MATTEPIVGLDAKLYYNTNTHASPTWVLVADCQDASSGIATTMVEIASRASNFKGHKPGLVNFSGTFSLLHTLGANTVITALTGMATGRTAKEFAFMDQLINTNTSKGMRFFAYIENMDLGGGLEEDEAWDITLQSAFVIESNTKVDPDWYVVGS
jgi:hypothetical protein